jgi:hypothetical protein
VQIPAPPSGEGSLLMDTTQELVAALSTDLDAAGAEIQEVKEKLMKTIREKAILEARLRGDPVLLSHLIYKNINRAIIYAPGSSHAYIQQNHQDITIRISK